MGMDVFGINPELKSDRPIMPDWDTATDKEKDAYFEAKEKWEAENPGVYFRNNVWWWHPLWDFVCMSCGDFMTEEDAARGHHNDGYQIDAERAKQIAERLTFLLKITLSDSLKSIILLFKSFSSRIFFASSIVLK